MTTAPARRGRPPVSTRSAIEAKAFELLLREGYEATTVEAITTAAGVGRTTFFRYFGSKPGVVWAEFDRAIDRLREALADADELDPMSAIRVAVVTSTRQSRDASPALWLDRFRVLDRDPALVAETAAHWRAWAEVLSSHLLQLLGPAVTRPHAAAIGAAVQAAYVEVLRGWVASTGDVDLDDLDRTLRPLVQAFQDLLGGVASTDVSEP